MTIATTTKKTSTALFSKDKSYLELIKEFIRTAEQTEIAVDDLKTLMAKLDEATSNAYRAMSALALLTGGRKQMQGEKYIGQKPKSPESAAIEQVYDEEECPGYKKANRHTFSYSHPWTD